MGSANIEKKSYPSVISQLLSWWFIEVPKNIYSGAIKIIINTYNYFSIGLLLKTLFYPWRRDEVDTSHMTIGQKVNVWIMNLVSRFMGAIVRSATIIAGLAIIVFEFFIGILFLAVFICMPVIALTLIIFGIIS